MQAERNDHFDENREVFESRISAGATEKLPGWEKLHAKTVAWSYDMEGHANKCVERNCELANKKTKHGQFVQWMLVCEWTVSLLLICGMR